MLLTVLALLIAAYGAFVATRTYLWQRRREEQRQRSDIEIGLAEQQGLEGELVVGEVTSVTHVLTVRVINRGEAPEYVHSIVLESQRDVPMTVAVRQPEGTVEVRPRDHEGFTLELDGSQAFAWDEPFRAVVRLANEDAFYSDYGRLSGPPSHGVAVSIPDPDAVADELVTRVDVSEGSRVARVVPPEREEGGTEQRA